MNFKMVTVASTLALFLATSGVTLAAGAAGGPTNSDQMQGTEKAQEMKAPEKETMKKEGTKAKAKAKAKKKAKTKAKAKAKAKEEKGAGEQMKEEEKNKGQEGGGMK